MSTRKKGFLSPSVARYALPAALFNLTLTPIAHTALAGENDSSLEEVVVTAQFRREKLQETPLAITAVTADMIEQRGLTRIEDIQKTAPNVSLRLAGNTNGQAVQAFIRGIGQTDSNLVLEPGVGVYVDDVYQGTLFGSTFDLLDLERVEVLRGPQGTLFGKNAIGGAIRLVSQQPTGRGEGWVELTGGDFDRIDMKGGFDVTVVPDTIFLRASGFSKKRSGYVDVIDFACARPAEAAPVAGAPADPPYRLSPQTSAGSGCKVGTQGGEDVKGARVALRILASPAVELNLAGDYIDNSSEAVASELVAVDAGMISNGAFGAFNQTFAIPNFGVPFDGRFVPPEHYQTYATYSGLLRNNGPGNAVTSTSIPAVNTVRSWGLQGTADFNISDQLQLKSITAYRAYDGATSAIVQNAPITIGYNYNVFLHNQFSQELRLTGTALSDRLEWAVGGFYFRGANTLKGEVSLNPFGVNFSQNDPSNVKDTAFFAQGTYHFLERFSITAGARYTQETKDFIYRHNFTAEPPEQTYKEWTPRASLDVQLTPEALVYVSYAKGFRAGGFNPRPFTPTQLTPFEPEYLDSYEAGFKTEWFNRSLVLNGAVFLGDYTNLILNSSRPDLAGVPFLGPLNVGQAEIRGVEIEFTARPVGELTINGSFGLADYKFKDLGSSVGCADPSVTAPVPGVNCVAGNPLYSSKPIGTPASTANLGIEYMFKLADSGSLTPRLDASYQSEVFWSNDNSNRSRTPGLTLLDARLTYTTPSEAWALAFGVTNLTDKFYFMNYNDLIAGGLGILEGQPSRPREWSISLRHKFN